MEHIHKASFDYALLLQAMGKLLPCDIGKQVFDIGEVYQVENDEQLQARLCKKEGK